jgi:hypothetical protein
VSELGSALLVGALFALVYIAVQINGNLIRIARVLDKMRDDNIAWRENVWKRDQR